MHNYSSTNWWHTCYPTFSKTNRNKHTKKESIKKKSSSCIVFPDNFNLTRYSCQCPNTQSQCSKNKSHFSQKTPAPHPDHVKMKISNEINDLHSANHKKTTLAKQSSAKKKKAKDKQCNVGSCQHALSLQSAHTKTSVQKLHAFRAFTFL